MSDAEARKQVLRSFSYGLYIVGLRQGDQIHAFTANWLSQVSFTPSLLAVSVENESRGIGMLRATGVCAIQVLADGQREAAGQLGRHSRQVPDKMAGLTWTNGRSDLPILDGVIGYVVARVLSETAAGDSTLFVLEVEDAVMLRAATPLTMAAAGFKHAG